MNDFLIIYGTIGLASQVYTLFNSSKRAMMIVLINLIFLAVIVVLARQHETPGELVLFAAMFGQGIAQGLIKRMEKIDMEEREQISNAIIEQIKQMGGVDNGKSSQSRR